jgi:hypothetical protein
MMVLAGLSDGMEMMQLEFCCGKLAEDEYRLRYK